MPDLSALGCLLALLSAGSVVTAAELEPSRRVTTDFPCGGSIEPHLGDGLGQTVYARRTSPWWAFRVHGVDPTRPLTLELSSKNAYLQAPFVYQRQDGTWSLLTSGQPIDEAERRVRYLADNPADPCVVASYAPYGLEQARERLVQVAAALPGSELIELGPSRDGRTVPAIRIVYPGRPEAQRSGIWIQARQHAWEITSSWATDGLLAWLAAAGPEAIALMERTEIVVVPIVEPDSVETGTGTMADPNPNRCWFIDEPSPYPQIPRIQTAIRELHQGTSGLAVFMDLHCFTLAAADQDWSYWATGFRDTTPSEQALAVLAAANAAVAAVDAGEYIANIPATYRTDYPGAGPAECPQMAALWVMSQFPETWSTTVEHSVFSRDRIADGDSCPVPADHQERGVVMARVIPAYLGHEPSAED